MNRENRTLNDLAHEPRQVEAEGQGGRGTYSSERQIVEHGIELEPQFLRQETRSGFHLRTKILEAAFAVMFDPAVHGTRLVIAAQHEPFRGIFYLGRGKRTGVLVAQKVSAMVKMKTKSGQ